MERERLERLLEEPAIAGREDLDGLRALTGRFPWFAGGHMLLAMGEQGSGEVLHEETLRTAAAHLPTRVPLFEAAHPPLPVTAPIERPVPPVDKGYTISIPEDQDLPAEQATGVAAAAPEEPAIPPIPAVSETGSEGSTAPQRAEPDPLDHEIRRAAMASGYELLLEHAVTNVPPPPGVEPDTPAPSPAASGHADHPPMAPEQGSPPPQPVEEEVSPEPPPVPVGKRRLRFTAWLDGDVTPTLPADRVATALPEADPATHPAAPEAPPATLAMEPTELVDRFIRTTTPETKPKTAFFTPQQAGKRSLDDTAGMVTETLARIYAQQGNVAKAMEAYGKLALKYPDKSAYFAALQKALEDRISK